MNKSNYKPCPDFNLAEIERLSPDILSSREPDKIKVNSFILALALAFNDLKGLLWVTTRLAECKPPREHKECLTPYFGQ